MKVCIVEGQRQSLMPNGPDLERNILGDGFEVNWYSVIPQTDWPCVLGEADAVIVRPGTAFPEEMVAALRKAKVIVSLGVGFDHIDIQAARQSGLPVCNVPDYGTEEVADSTVAMILALLRKINVLANRRVLDQWDWRLQIPIRRTRSLMAGIIGLGRIGTAVALRLKAFGMNVCFFDPYRNRGTGKALGIEQVHDADTLVQNSDIISIHAPLTPHTKAMVNARFFRLLKPDAILINTARGGIFESLDAMLDALREMPRLCIGTDVLPVEPPIQHPLLQAFADREEWLAERLLICPHAAFYSEQACEEMRRSAATIVRHVLSGNEPYNVVNGE